MKPQSVNPHSVPSPRGALLTGIAAIVLLVSGLGVWGSQAMISGAVVASGRVIVDSNRQAIQHPEGGIVATVLVREGDRVERGDVLVRLDQTLTLSELRVVEGQLFELMARRARLAAERDDAGQVRFDAALIDAAAASPTVADLVRGQEALFAARFDGFRQGVVQLENQKQQLRNQVEGIDAVNASLVRQIALTQEEMTAQETLLERGLAQGTRVLNLRREVARLSGSIGEVVARRGQAMERIAEIEIEILRQRGQRREDAITQLRDLQVSENELTERRHILVTRLGRMDIRAPVSGLIHDVRLLGEQSVLRPAEPALFIVPDGRPLRIETRISPVHVNSVHLGQQVVVRFPAFDMRQTPDLFGRVVNLSPDAYADTDHGGAFYRAEVELPGAEISKLADDQHILPGMPVDTFLRTGEYTPLDYLTRPLTRYIASAMREGA